MTRLILSLIIWHSRCTFFTIKSHLLNCTLLYCTQLDRCVLYLWQSIHFFLVLQNSFSFSILTITICIILVTIWAFFQPYSCHSYYWYSICYSFIWLVSLQLLYIWFVPMIILVSIDFYLINISTKMTLLNREKSMATRMIIGTNQIHNNCSDTSQMKE